MAAELRLPIAEIPVPGGVDPRFARSAGFWLRAYPRRWRAARGAEVLGVLADLAGPGARRLGARAAADVVRAGWAARLRGRPPLGRYLLYRLADVRLPAEHRPWVADDVAGLWFPLRTTGLPPLLVVLVLVPWRWESDSSVLQMLGAMVLAATAVQTLWPDAYRRRHAARHLVPRTGEPVLPGAYLRVAVPRCRVTAGSMMPAVVGSLGVVAVVGSLATLVGPLGHAVRVLGASSEHGPGFEVLAAPITDRAPAIAMLVVGAALGVVGAGLARRRLRLVRRAVDQPDRRLVRASAGVTARVVVGVALVAALPALEVVGATPVTFGPVLGLLSLAAMPAAVVVAAALSRSTGPTVAFVDVWHAVGRGRPPRPDTPAHAIEPVRAVLPGAVMPFPHAAHGRARLG